MGQLIHLPHLTASGLCPVNGIRDLIHARTGRNWSNEFLWGLGQGGGFAYLRINPADPPRQMYTGIDTPHQHRYLANLLGAGLSEVENRAFKFSWAKAREAVDAGAPPVLGPLDMFYLPYYPALYHQRHIPIHFILLVGYDDACAYILDTELDEVQALPLSELQQAWNVSVPGLGKRNRLAVLDIPRELPPTAELIRKSILDQCATMLQPPISILGIPAMEKLARDIPRWPTELGEETAARCLHQVREYLNSPPDAEGDHLTAGRDRYVQFLQEAGEMAGLDFSAPIDRLCASMAVIPGLAQAIRRYELEKAGAGFMQVAAFEKQAFQELRKILAPS